LFFILVKVVKYNLFTIDESEDDIFLKQKTRKVSSKSKKTPIDMGGDARKLQVSTDFRRNPSEEGAACFRLSEQDSNVVSVEFTLND
jgi:hypothetical protein